MTTETIKFRLGKNPLIKEKIIVLEETDGRKAVIFPQYRVKEEIEHAEVAKEGEVLQLTGKWGTDKKTNKPQFLVDSAYNATYEKELDAAPAKSVKLNNAFGEYSISDSDLVAGNETKYGQIRKEGNPLKEKIYFTDGEHYWYEDSKMKTPCVF